MIVDKHTYFTLLFLFLRYFYTVSFMLMLSSPILVVSNGIHILKSSWIITNQCPHHIHREKREILFDLCNVCDYIDVFNSPFQSICLPFCNAFFRRESIEFSVFSLYSKSSLSHYFISHFRRLVLYIFWIFKSKPKRHDNNIDNVKNDIFDEKRAPKAITSS